MRPPRLTGAILAAGKGTRMAPLSDTLPKPVLPICNRPLIEHQIETMKSIGIDDIVVVLGHKGYEIAKILGDGSRLEVRIRYVEQQGMFGLAHAVGQLEPHLRNPFLLMLGDIFFVPNDLRAMIDAFALRPEGAILAVKEEPDADSIRKNFSVRLSPEGLVTRVIEKPRYTENRLKGVGLYLFDVTIFDAIRRTPRTALRDEYELTEAIQVYIDDGYPVRVSPSIREDINLTYPSDLLNCNLLLAAREHDGQLIAADAHIPETARVSRSVIGPGAVIDHPISIERALILPGTHVTTQSDIDGLIIGPDGFVDCTHFSLL